MAALRRIFVVLVTLGAISLLGFQSSLAQPAPWFEDRTRPDEDDVAALARWGTIEDPNVAAIFTEEATRAVGAPVIGVAYYGYDKETGERLDDPTTTYVERSALADFDDKAPPDAGAIRFGSQQLLLTTSAARLSIDEKSAAALPADEFLALQFSYPVDLDVIDELAAQGVVFGDPLDRLSFYAKIPLEAVAEVARAIDEGKISFLGRVPPSFQVSDGLYAQLAVQSPGDGVAVTVQLFEPPTPELLAEIGALMQIERRSDGPMHLIEGVVPAGAVASLASPPAVQMVHEALPNTSGAELGAPVLRTDLGRPLTNLEGNLGTGGDALKSLGLTGTSVRVAVVDSGIARTGTTYHPDLPSSRILDQYSWYPSVGTNAEAIDSHGTHVAGTIGGSGVGSTGQVWQGIAPNVNFLIYRLCCNAPGGFGYFSSDFQAALTRAAGQSADVVNNSWGGGNHTYAVSSQLADRAVRGEFGSRHMSIVAITHNDNALSRSPGTAKNAITVGAVKDGNWPNVAVTSCGGVQDTNFPPGQRVCFSNFGPIDVNADGNSRVKPDLMAPGVRTQSPVAWYLYPDNRYYDTFNGTSMAAPQVAGVIAQFIQAFPGYRQWPEVIKAALIASATNVGGSDIARYGRGMVNGFHAITNQAGISATARWSSSLASSGNRNDHAFVVPAGFSEVRVALAWADPVAGANNDAVINDLDLRVYDGNGTLRASSLTIGDTVEYVKVTTGAPGTWRIEVRAFSISSAQPYGLTAVVVQKPAELSMSTQLEPQVGTIGASVDSFYLYTTLSNAGFAAPGSYVRLHLPSTTLFAVQGARVYTRDGRSHYYSAADLHNDVGGLYWRVAVGETIAGHPRVVRWFISYAGSTSCPTVAQTFTASAWHRDNGAVAVGGATSATFTNLACTYVPLLSR